MPEGGGSYMTEAGATEPQQVRFGVERPVDMPSLSKFLEGVPDGRKFVVAAGKGWVADPQADGERFEGFGADSGFHRLSTEARLTALASTLLVLSGKAERVIFTGGRTAGPDNVSEAKAMKDYALSMFGEEFAGKEVDEIFQVEDESFDTVANAENVRQKGVTGENALLVTIGYHEPRAADTFEKVLGKRPGTVRSDDLIRAAMPQHRHLGQYDRRQEKRWFEVAREFVARSMQANEITSRLMQRAAQAKRSK